MMKSTKPYLLEALYRCISDSKLTPLLYVKCDILGVQVPPGYDNDGYIVLDVSHDAVTNLKMQERFVSFEAIFDNAPFNIYLPMPSILAIRCAENDIGIEFGLEPVDATQSHQDEVTEDEATDGGEAEAGDGGRKKPHLTVL